MTRAPSVALADVAQLNPSLISGASDDEVVSFLPMAAVDADLPVVVDSEARRFVEVRKGYTPLLSGDVLVAKITPCFENGKIARAELRKRIGFGSTEFHIVRADQNRLDPRYLTHFLRQRRIRREGELRMTGSAGQRRVPEAFLADLRVLLPSIAEQRRIADILDNADALRAKRRAALAQQDALTQSIFLDMFGDGGSPSGEATTIGEVADVQGGLQLTSSRDRLPLRVPYLRVANVYRGRLDLCAIKSMGATDAEIARTRLVPGDMLVVEGHGNPGEIGRAALWNGEIPLCSHQNHLIRARFDQRRIVPLFACTYVNSAPGRRHLLRSGKSTSGLNTISVSNVRATPLMVPSVKRQLQFAERVEAVERIRAQLLRHRDSLDALFASLQHRAFRGEL